MAGRPMLERLARDIEAREGGEEYIFERLADGEPVGRVAESFGVSRRMLYTWRDMHGHEKRRRQKWDAALRASAEAHAEDGLEDLEKLTAEGNVPTSAEVQAATGRAKYRQWLASKRNPEQFGDRAMELNINFGQLHLDAVQQSKQLAPPVVEAEVLAIEGGDDNNGPTPRRRVDVAVGDAGDEPAGALPSAPEAPNEVPLPNELADLM
jgi:transposase-like protein